MEDVRISVLVVNLNTLDYTKQCIDDLLTQDIQFNLTIINQNSNEVGTEEYLDELFKNHINGNLKSNLHVLTVRNSGYNKPLNKIWNDFVTENDTEFICLLNNDVRISPNFLSSAIQVLDNEPIVGFVNHVTNNKDYQYWSNKLEYEIIQQPYRQGWDPIFRRECYSDIPENLILYFGDDYIYSKLYYSGYKGAYVLNSPMIHLCSATTPNKGRFNTGDSDRSLYMSMTDVYHHLSFDEKFSKLTPEFYEIITIEDKPLLMSSIYGSPLYRTGHFGVTYNDINMVKCPFDYVLLQMLINEIKPDLIIEIGTYLGGSALYMADIIKNFNINCEIHTIDLHEKIYDEKIINNSYIKCFFGGFENYDINITTNFKNVLIIDDGSHTSKDIINAFNKFKNLINKGSYYIIEDGIVNLMGLSNYFDGGPKDAIYEILKNNTDFIIDKKYCNFFGENYTFNINGYLKKI
jgi:cephalosporin hydroxylase